MGYTAASAGNSSHSSQVHGLSSQLFCSPRSLPASVRKLGFEAEDQFTNIMYITHECFAICYRRQFMFMSHALYMSINVMYIIFMYIKLYKHNFEEENTFTFNLAF